MATEVSGYPVDKAMPPFSGKTKKVVAVVDSLGYTDSSGYVRYVDRGTEVEVPVEEVERLSQADPVGGLFPAVVEPDHPHLAFLVNAVRPDADPNLSIARLRMAHGGGDGLFDPAGDDASRARTGPDPGDDKGPWNIPALGGVTGIDWNELDAKSLKKVAAAAGIEGADSMKKGELVEALNARSAPGDVTPRVGDVSTPEGDEAASDSASDASEE